MMAEGGQVSKAQLKRDLDALGKDLYNINFQKQKICQGQQQGHIPTREQAKVEVQKQVVSRELELTKLNAQTWAFEFELNAPKSLH